MSQMTPGTITTLDQLRPGDVARYLVNDDEPGTEFVVGGRRGTAVYVQYPNPANNHYGDDDSPMARYLGRGRIEPARIVMDGEPDRVAELEAQVRALRALREAIEKYSIYAQARGSAPFGATGEEAAALAATDPNAKEKPCTI